MAELTGMFPGVAALTDDERHHTSGRFREGEDRALHAVLAGVALRPSLFASLADQDEGHDPGVFEVELLTEPLERRALLQRLSASLGPFSDQVRDSTLRLGDQTRPALLAAYRIAKTVAESDRALRQKVGPALDFYGSIGKAAAAARGKKG